MRYSAESHFEFQDRLEKSKPAVFAMAKHFAWVKGRTGATFEIEVPEVKVAPRPEDRRDYVDKGDILLHWGSTVMRVEVKWFEGWDFTSAFDCPWKRILIMEVRKWEQAEPKATMVLLVNRAMTYFGYVDVRINPVGTWETKMVRDSRAVDDPDEEHETYCIDPHLISFTAIQEEEYEEFRI